MPDVRCTQCGKVRTIADSHLKRLKHAPTCGRKCRAKAMTGTAHWNWRGGKTHEAQRPDGSRGYVRVLDPKTGRYVYEHRRVMEVALGRKLRRNERVRHKDGNLANNRRSNLLIKQVQTSAPRRKRPVVAS